MDRKTIKRMMSTGMVTVLLCCQMASWAQEVAPLTVKATEAATLPEAKTRVLFNRGLYKPGIEQLRVVRRENTTNNVATQVALSVGLSLLSRGVAFGAQGFSKDDLAGVNLEELQNDPVAVNPAMNDLKDALSLVATDIYRKRTAQALALAKQDGSTAKEIEEAGRVQTEADTPLHSGSWHLIYENLPGTDELFRLKFSAELGRAGFMRPPAVCRYESEAIPWLQWQADHWQMLRDERAKAVTRCAEVLSATPEKFW
jgi:hypothetical protein